MQYTYSLEKYNGPGTRHTCPACGKRREFARYVDADGHYLADHVGRCNRESSCGYHFKPAQHFQDNPTAPIQPARHAKPEPVKPIQYIPGEVLERTLRAYEHNTFVTYLHTLFDRETVAWLIDRYFIGTTKSGSCLFWQVDEHAKIRTGKVIHYGPDGHRDKLHKPYFIHLKLKLETISQCLFGQHLMAGNSAPIGLVESEKTAVIMAGKVPQYLWMATGAKLNLSKVDALKGRKVVAFPDTDGHQEWSNRLAPYGFKVSDCLTKFTDEPGKDLADFITAPNKTENYFEKLSDGRTIEMCPAGYPASWN